MRATRLSGRKYSRFNLRMAGLLAGALGLVVARVAAADPDWEALDYTPIHMMQAVHTDGSPAWSVPTVPPDHEQAYKLRGVVLNNPADMLDGTPDWAPEGPLWYMGGQWQVFVEAVSLPEDPLNHPELVGDFGGAAMWIGQDYGNHIWHFPDPDYCQTDAEWLGELQRLDYPVDVNTGLPVEEPLRVGDLVEIRARGGLYYRGKCNVNEQHDVSPALDFDMVILQRDLAVTPAPIHLSDVKDAADLDLFDPTRASGGECYQGRYVRLVDVSITGDSDWGTGGAIMVTDREGRTLPVRLGIHPCWDTSSPPVGRFDLLGVFDQDATDIWTSTDGYQMWALALRDFHLDADLNGDGLVGGGDLDIIRAYWGRNVTPGRLDHGDPSGDGLVAGDDLDLVRANWGFGVSPPPAAVPEPAMVVMMLSAVASLLVAAGGRCRIPKRERASE